MYVSFATSNKIYNYILSFMFCKTGLLDRPLDRVGPYYDTCNAVSKIYRCIKTYISMLN